MRRTGYLAVTAIIAFGFLFSATVNAQTDPKIGVRAGLGTDVNLGIAYGADVNYLLTFPQNSLELGVVMFGGSFEESTDEGIHTYDETTDIFVFGLLANYMINYTPDQQGTFFIAGVGLANINVEWEERSG